MSQNNLKVWEINSVSLPLDLEDADVMERYENAFQQMQQDEISIPKDGKASDRIRAYCNLYRKLYDNLFGDGTADKIFAGQPMSTAVYEETYLSFLEFVRAQSAAANERRNALLDKYRPNRAQKRAAIKQAKKK